MLDSNIFDILIKKHFWIHIHINPYLSYFLIFEILVIEY